MEVNVKNLITLLIIFILYLSNLNAFNLQDGFKLALDNDMDSKVNENNLKNIQYDLDIADSLLYPKLDFTGKVDSTKRTDGQKTPSAGTHTKSDSYEFQVTQPLFDGFEAKYEKELQKYIYDSAVFYLKESQNDVAINYVQSYINVLREKDLLALNNESVSVSEDMFKKVYKKIQLGYGTKLEYEEVKGYLNECKVNVDIQRINLKEALESLRYYVQREFDSSELRKPSLFIPLPETLDKAVKTALKENPTVNVAKTNLAVAKAQEKQSYKEFYPNVNLVASYNLNDSFYPNDDAEYNEYSVGLEVNYNLYNGGKNIAEAKKAFQNIKEKQFLIRKSEYQVKNRVRLAWNSYELNRDKHESLKQYLIAKKDILDATFKEFDLGLQDLNSVLEKYIDYYDVKKDYISNTYDLLYAKYDLLGTIGKLSDALLGKLPQIKEEIDENIENTPNLFKAPNYNYENEMDMKNNKLKVMNSSKELLKEKEYDDTPIIRQNSYELPTNKSKEKDESFKQRFLSASRDKYTINLALSNSERAAQKFIDNYDLNSEAFFFSFGYDKPLQKIVMGVFDTKKEAKEVLANLDENLQKNRPLIEKIAIKQDLYKKYHGINQTDKNSMQVENKTDYKIYKASFSTASIKNGTNNVSEIKSLSFKDKFLLASKNKYTINLAYTNSEKKAKIFLDNHNINSNAFFFSFGYEKPLQKIMFGVYDSKSEAQKALKALSITLRRNSPRIEKISLKQELYKKYHPNSYNSILSGSI